MSRTHYTRKYLLTRATVVSLSAAILAVPVQSAPAKFEPCPTAPVVSDEFTYLEDSANARTKDWVRQQNERTLSAFDTFGPFEQDVPSRATTIFVKAMRLVL